MNKVLSFLLLVVVATVAAEAETYQRNGILDDMINKVFHLVEKHAEDIIKQVKSAAAAVLSETKLFFDGFESSINKSVDDAVKGLESLKTNETLNCYTKATKDLAALRAGAIEDLHRCQNISKSAEEIISFEKASVDIVKYIINDAKLIKDGVLECKNKMFLLRIPCAAKYFAKLVKSIWSQWPKAEEYVKKARTLGKDIIQQVQSCLTTARHSVLENHIKEVIKNFNLCAKKHVLALQ